MNRSFQTTTPTATERGAQAEERAQAWLQRQGLVPVLRNYRCKGGEIDLIMRAGDDTVVFVEVRQRRGRGFGGAAQSITPAKQRRVLHAAAHYLATLDTVPACRVDVVALEAGRIEWMPGAFDLTSAAGNDGADAAS